MSATPLSPEEEAAVRELVAVAPEAQRRDLERLLRDPNTRVWKTSRPELQPLLDVVARGHRRRTLEGMRQLSVAQARSHGAKVTLALVEAAQIGGARVAVERSDGEEPRNLILLAPEAAPEDLAAGLGALQLSRRQFGDNIFGVISVKVRSARPSPASVARGAALLRQLRDAPERTLAKYGRVRAMDSSVGPTGAPRS